jgi:hypothetical protein
MKSRRRLAYFVVGAVAGLSGIVVVTVNSSAAPSSRPLFASLVCGPGSYSRFEGLEIFNNGASVSGPYNLECGGFKDNPNTPKGYPSTVELTGSEIHTDWNFKSWLCTSEAYPTGGGGRFPTGKAQSLADKGPVEKPCATADSKFGKDVFLFISADTP